MPDRCPSVMLAAVVIAALTCLPFSSAAEPPAPGEAVNKKADGVVPPIALTIPSERRAAFYKRQITDAYRAFGVRDAVWDAAAVQLLDDFCDYQAYHDYSADPHPRAIPTLDPLQTQRDDLIAAGCDDPFVLYILTLLNPERQSNWRTEDWEVEQQLRASAAEQDDADRYLTAFICTERMLLREHLSSGEANRTWADKNRLTVLNTYAGLFRPGYALNPDDAAQFARIFEWYCDDIDIKLADQLMQATADVDAQASKRWLAKVVRGQLYFETAWKVRGGGWASTVKDDQWRKFGVYLQLAQDEYEAAWALNPTRAEPATRMIAVAMGQSSGDEMKWFNRALTADPYDNAAYRHMQWAHRTRWGGNSFSMLAIANRALSSGAYQTEIPDYFDKGLDDILSDYGDDWLSANRLVVWPLIERYLEGRAAQPSPHRSADWCWSRGLSLAHQAGFADKAWAYFEKLDQDPQRLVTPHKAGLDQRWSIGAMATQREPAVQEACERAEALREAGDIDDAIALLDQTANIAQNPWSKRHVGDLRRVALWDKAFGAGERIDLLAHGLEGWRVVRGQFKSVGKELHAIYLNEGGGLRLICGLEPGTRYEAEMAVELPGGFFNNHWGGVGFLFDPRIRVGTSRHVFTSISRSHRNAIWVQDLGNREDRHQKFGEYAPIKNATLRLQRWDQSLRVWLNGELIIERYDLQGDWPRGGELGIASWHTAIDSPYIFKKINIRRLDASPFLDPNGGILLF